MTRILYGQEFAEPIKELIKNKTSRRNYRLVVVTSGNDPASQVYVRNKLKVAEEVGIETKEVHVDKTMDAVNAVAEINYPFVNSKMIVQQPYANEFHDILAKLQESLPNDVDVDGLNPTSLYTPATALGVMVMLKEFDLTGKHVVILGRSKLVGHPLIDLCLKRNATVTSCNSFTKDLASITRTADVLISAIGKPKFVTADMVKQDAIVIDVGINRDENGKLCGDVDFENVKDKCLAITPVPKGVGVMTTTMLMANVVGLDPIKDLDIFVQKGK